VNDHRDESLARLLEYPGDDFAALLDAHRARWDDDDLAALAAAVEGLSTPAIQELYIQTFDFNPKCTLDLGWQLFAEDYNRGLFLAKLRTESRRLGLEETSELPDHLTHVLRLLARMTPAEAADLAAACAAPAVEQTLAAVPEDNPYRSLVAAALSRLRELAAMQEEAVPT